MAVPATNVSWQDFRTTFGSDQPGSAVSMADYYRGTNRGSPTSGLVDVDTPNAGYGIIPQSGALSAGNLRLSAKLQYVAITGSQTWTAPSTLIGGSVSVCLVGGGGGGGFIYWIVGPGGLQPGNPAYGNEGGGGGGGVLTQTISVTPGNNYVISIGSGGYQVNGVSSTGFGLTAPGGGLAGWWDASIGDPATANYNANSGGSGGGANWSGTAGGASPGNPGANGAGDGRSTAGITSGDGAPGGGGGAMGSGTQATDNVIGGNGGAGLGYTVYNGPRNPVNYSLGGGGGGGGGGIGNGGGGNGGARGGGNGSNGSTNSGGGGGGMAVTGSTYPVPFTTGAGASGICLIMGYW